MLSGLISLFLAARSRVAGLKFGRCAVRSIFHEDLCDSAASRGACTYPPIPFRNGSAHGSQDFHWFGTQPLYLVVFTLDTTGTSPHNARTFGCVIGFSGELWRRPPPSLRRWGKISMQYLPGFTIQCINAFCDLRGHWLRADASGPISEDGRCPCCGDMLRTVPPPLGPRFRMRPRPLTARPPLRPRPR
jgi:hypothetical protein